MKRSGKRAAAVAWTAAAALSFIWAAFSAAAASPTRPSKESWVGVWVNENRDAGGITMLVVDPDLTVHGYSRCLPSFCIWGCDKLTLLSDGEAKTKGVFFRFPREVRLKRITGGMIVDRSSVFRREEKFDEKALAARWPDFAETLRDNPDWRSCRRSDWKIQAQEMPEGAHEQNVAAKTMKIAPPSDEPPLISPSRRSPAMFSNPPF